jgi:hypothetical protein
MTNRINPAMKTMEAAGPKPLGDAAGMNTSTEELAGRDHAVLVRRDPSDQNIGCRFGAFPPHRGS